ncbi:tryptophan-rich sensory protein [Sporosarcina sp. OR05]|uniref:tryptophan-rich sensory protein n=1 Tax=Sporosarcina sp. OR05 TaxID=2969819 RepID=UPI00352B5E6D
MKSTNKRVWLNTVIVLTYVLMIGTNVLANVLPINGQTTGEVSAKYGNLFAPAGFTFSIWSVIYVLLLLHVFYQLGFFHKKLKPSTARLLTQVGIYFSISSILNTLWILAWHYERLFLSVILMVGLLLCLIKINKLTAEASLSLKESFFIKLPFSIYFGWITVATIANITAFLVSIGWDGFGLSDVTWTILILIIGTVISVGTMLRLHNPAYGLAILWAYFGIYSKHTSESGFNNQYPAISLTVIICMIILSLTILLVAIGNRRKPNT